MNDWMNQSKQWFDTWANAQQALWSSWQKSAATPAPAEAPAAAFWTQWQKMVTETMGAFGGVMATPFTGGEEGWDSYYQQWQSWLGNFTQVGGGAPLRALEEALTPWLESPPLGLTREMERKLRQLFQASLALQRASAEYQAVLGDAWLNVGQQMQQALLDNERPAIESMGELAALWSEVADPAFLDIFRSERYIRAQGALLEATMQVRLRQRAVTEVLAETLDLPTRTEMDAAHKINYEQGKAIKALRKELAGMQARLEALEKKPARRSPRKKAAPKAAAEA
jgi:class III poly(R)-hydroxyalkanoic acid synthase PhaE subunit